MLKLVKKLQLELAVLIIFVASRVPHLGYDIFNTDVWKWKARTYNFGSGVFGLDFAETIQKYHPGVVLMWIGTFAVKVFNLFYSFDGADNELALIFKLHFVQKLCVVIVIGITMAFIFYALRQLLGLKYACIAVFLLAIDPFYVALTRVFHLEGLMSTFMLASFVWLYWYLKAFQKHQLILSAIFAGLSILTKTSSLFLVPFAGLVLLIEHFIYKTKPIKFLASTFGLWLGIVALTFVLLWPAMWTNAADVFTTLYRGIFSIGVEQGHEQVYFGRVMNDPGMGFYFVVLALKSSIYFLPGLVGFVFLLITRKLSIKDKQFALHALLFGVFYTIELSLSSKKLDRYILPTLLSFTLISTFFYRWLWATLRFYLLLLFLPALLILARVHPDYFSYFSPYFGGLRTGITILEPKWMIGARGISDYVYYYKTTHQFEDVGNGETVDSLKADALKKKLLVGFQEKYYAQIWPFVRAVGAETIVKDLTPHARMANIFIYPVWNDDSYLEDRFLIRPVGEISLRGVTLYRVYERYEHH